MSASTTVGVWMGLRRCGCPVAVCVVDTQYPMKDVEKSKREFLKQGYDVVYADWQEWVDTYSPKFRATCEHESRRAVAEEATAEQSGLDLRER